MAWYKYTLKGNVDIKVGEIDLEYYNRVKSTIYSMLKSSRIGNMSEAYPSQPGKGWSWSGQYKTNRQNGGIIRDYGMSVAMYPFDVNSQNSGGRRLATVNYMTQSEARSITDSDFESYELQSLSMTATAFSALLSVINTGTRGDELISKFPEFAQSAATYNFDIGNIFKTSSSNGSITISGSSILFPTFHGWTPNNNIRQYLINTGAKCDLRFPKRNDPAATLNLVKTKSMYYSTTWSRSYQVGGSPIGQTISIVNGQDTNQYGMFNVSGTTNIPSEEFYEDSENTYPGGGDDKNTYPDDDSESPGGESGKGDFDNTNNPIDFPTLPTFDVQSTGFISLWNPTITQLTSLYTFLWDSDISTTLKKLFNEPMNAIFSLGIVPVDPVTQGTRRLTIGHVDTEIDMESIQKQFVTFDFGSIDITEYYGAAWDYSPYTQASIYLPYIGVQPVDIDDIMNCTLTLRYNIDVLTGTTIALLKCVRKGRDNLNAVMYEWQGNCVTQCPITAGNWSQIMASVIQLGAMTGLALSQPVVGAIGSAVGSSAAAEYAQGKNLVNPTMATYGALNVLGSKVHVQRGGRIDMSAGAMSMQKAYVILNRPISGIPRGWNNYAGYPSLKIKTLGSQEGFVSVGAIKLDGLRATANEIGELDAILKAGVII